MAGWEDGTATRPAVVTASAVAVGDDAMAVADPNLLSRIGTDYQQASTSPVEVTVAVADTAVQSAALAKGLYLITSDLDACFLAGANPTADAADRRLWAKTYRWLYIATANDKVSVVNYNAAETPVVSIELIEAG